MNVPDQIRPLADIPLVVEARLPCGTMTVEQLLSLKDGSLIRSDRAAGDNCDVQVGGQLLGSAEMIVLGNALGCRITDFREKN
ncbi:MAG TPA: FliM/FliN family flagellar motor switch protein [Bryobacteraceae bacterium]|nr:FliM/FliN family flagellar motor switch protein [Bryobacteraceae bacterium]